MKRCVVCSKKIIGLDPRSKICGDACRHERSRRYHALYFKQHREDLLAKQRSYNVRNRDRLLQKQKEWYRKNKKEKSAYDAKYREANRAKIAAKKHEDAPKLAKKRKEQLLAIYGNACECCGERTFEFLTLDHVGGGGATERRILQQSQIIRAALKKPDPDRYRILCFNCNLSYGLYGICPHVFT